MNKTMTRGLAAMAAAVVLVGGGYASADAAGLIGSEDLAKNSVGASELKPGVVHWNHVAQPVKNRINTPAEAPQGAVFTDEDGSTTLPENVKTTVGSLALGMGSYIVNANVTVSSGNVDTGNMVCSLQQGDTQLSTGNAKGERESFGLTATAAAAEAVDLVCYVNDKNTAGGGGSATDVSMSAVEVTLP